MTITDWLAQMGRAIWSQAAHVDPRAGVIRVNGTENGKIVWCLVFASRDLGVELTEVADDMAARLAECMKELKLPHICNSSDGSYPKRKQDREAEQELRWN